MNVTFRQKGSSALKLRYTPGIIGSASIAQGGFWSDVDTEPVKLWKFRDRVLVGNAVNMKTIKSDTASSATWLNNAAAGPTYLLSCGQNITMHEKGGCGIVAMTRASDKASYVSGMTTIGISSYAKGDHTSGRVWAGYFESDLRNTGMGAAYGIEIDVKCLTGVNVASSAYSTPNGGTYGLWIAGGGDPSYGGAPTNPSTAAIQVVANGTTWNRGIVFAANSLTGTDGVTGGATAIEFARGHKIRWGSPGNNEGAVISSIVSTANAGVGIDFRDNRTAFTNWQGLVIGEVVAVTDPANYISSVASVAGATPRFSANGTDTNCDFGIRPKGTGTIDFQIGGSAASSAGAFSATNRVRIKLNGTTVYVPYMTTAW